MLAVVTNVDKWSISVMVNEVFYDKVRYLQLAVISVIIPLIFGCNKRSVSESKTDQLQKSSITYAKRFDIIQYDSYKKLVVNRPSQHNTGSLVYNLYTGDDEFIIDKSNSHLNLRIPSKSIICTSTTHIAFLEILGVDTCLVGFPQTKFIYSPQLRSRIDSKLLAEVGLESDLNIERILGINPDFIMAFSAGAESPQLIKLQELGMNVIMNADYLESTVLGRAEWIKFIGAFFNKELEANEYFDQLVLDYTALVDITRDRNRPTVMTGVLYGGNWFLAGGKNHVSGLINDAGGNYLWSDDPEEGWLSLDFERVYATAASADVWVGATDFKSLDDLKRADSRYQDFKAFKEGNVYAYTGRINEAGANDYFESGIARPDVLLKDHIKMIHPDLLPDYELFYYRKLQ